MIAAGLGEVATCGDAKLDAQMLEQDRHEIGNHDDHQQGVAKLRAASEVSRPVARVHVTYGHEETGAGERKKLSPE